MSGELKAVAYRRGIYVFLVLAVLTAVEYLVAISFNSTVLLFIIALLKAAAIVQYFMHVYRLWREESH
ncbi:MAG: cytochrome C oxidase subunit IV family protein [Anaerolineales bacterium]|nr:cytochrome C oxidase subunit IV family protein [Anaerolineales bacterium]